MNYDDEYRFNPVSAGLADPRYRQLFSTGDAVAAIDPATRAHLGGLSRREAAREIAIALGISHWEVLFGLRLGDDTLDDLILLVVTHARGRGNHGIVEVENEESGTTDRVPMRVASVDVGGSAAVLLGHRRGHAILGASVNFGLRRPQRIGPEGLPRNVQSLTTRLMSSTQAEPVTLNDLATHTAMVRLMSQVYAQLGRHDTELGRQRLIDDAGRRRLGRLALLEQCTFEQLVALLTSGGQASDLTPEGVLVVRSVDAVGPDDIVLIDEHGNSWMG